MKCAACDRRLPPGKIIFCPPCFFSLPRKEQGELASHYIRVAKAEGKPVDANHPGIRDKVAKLAKMIWAKRGTTEATPLPVVTGPVLIDAPRRTESMLQFNRGTTQ